MALQVHGIVENADDLDVFLVSIAIVAEYDEVSGLPSPARGVQRKETFGQIQARSCAGSIRSCVQFDERAVQKFGIGPRLFGAELFARPTSYG